MGTLGLILAVGFIAVLAGVAIWLNARHQRRRRAEAESEASAKYAVLGRAFAALDTSEYLAFSSLERWRIEQSAALSIAREPGLARYLSQQQASEYEWWSGLLVGDGEAVRRLNQTFIERRLEAEKAAFDRVEAYPLTSRQRTAIVTDQDTTQVIAGAGTGKTSTIVGKVDYLVRRGLARPSEILVLAFARKASEELKERLGNFGSAASVDVSTFHALGLRIVGTVDGRRPALSKLADDGREMKRYLRDRVAEMLEEADGRELLVRFLATFANEGEPGTEDGTGDDGIRQERIKGLRALDGTRVKSGEEKQIANWFILNGINWEYERTYPVDTATPWRRAYRPDFYLPEHDLYLEHFGIDRQNRTAPQVNRKAYLEAMQWKRDLHEEEGTTLLETFSWMSKEGGLIQHLEGMLTAQGVKKRPLTPDEIAAITADANRPFSDFISLLAQFLTVFKGGGADLTALNSRAESERDRAFIGIFAHVYKEYEAALATAGEIDFNDMINRAREYVEELRFTSPYRYVIVDEFQDISANRIGLLQGMRRQQPGGRLFVVGDDWQSIYRFTGSDVGIITDLPDHVGATERVDLDIAFRYPQELLDVTSQFVTANPRQLRKELRAHQGHQGTLPLCVVYEPNRRNREDDEEEEVAGSLPPAIERVLDEIAERKDEGAETVFILGRYHFNQPEDLQKLSRRAANAQLKVEFMTAHASKGKEADYVVVVGLDASEYGFPSRVSDDPVMRLVLSADEDFPYAEERRLFYVAMTRAKRRVYLIAPDLNASPFIAEDLLGEGLSAFVEVIGEVSELHVCPRCEGKTIRRKQGPYGTFWACAHYPLCHGRLDSCPQCKKGGLTPADDPIRKTYRCNTCAYSPETCPRCGEGILLPRTGRRGPFLGCSRYSGGDGCRYTRDSN